MFGAVVLLILDICRDQAMTDLIASLRPDERANFRLRRDRNILEVPVRIGKRPPIRAERD